MKFQKLRELILAMLLDLWERMKPERIQDRTLAGETPMTTERIVNRALEAGYDLIWAPVAIRKTYRHADFAEAVDFVHGTVAGVAATASHSPKVVIDGDVVVVTLGIEIPNLLSEADFDVAEALKEALDGGEDGGEAGGGATPRSG